MLTKSANWNNLSILELRKDWSLITSKEMSATSENINKENTKLVDIEKVIASKNPKLLKTLPRFIINYLKRVIHEEDINNFVSNYKHLKGIDYARQGVKTCKGDLSHHGLENIPADGRYLFVANHPLGGLDGIALIAVVGERFPNIKFPVNDILLNLDGLKDIFIPINKHGSNSKDAARQLDDAYASDCQMLYFPAGMVSRKINGKITDLEWKKNFIKKAITYERDIIPVHVEGRNTRFFYNLARIRKFLGIKANIEMLYLPDELFNDKTKKIVINFGQPVPWQRLKSEGTPDEWVKTIREATYALAPKTK